MSRPRCLARLLLTLLGVCALSAGVMADEAPAQLVRRLHSPLAAERDAAVRDLMARGPVARDWARTWIEASDSALRRAGWRVLGECGEAGDVRPAAAALADAQPEVGRAAAEALRSLVGRLPAPDEPWLPAGALTRAQVRTLAWAVATDLLESPAGVLPGWIRGTGEGLVPCLEHVLQHPRFEIGVRRVAVTALAAVGGDEARRVLGRLVPSLVEMADAALWEAWWRALVEIGPGPGHEQAHDLVVEFAREALGSRWSDRPPGLRWRNQGHFYRFIATCPPSNGRETVVAYLDDLLEAAAHGVRRRLYPSLAAEAVRAHLVMAPPDDQRLAWDVLAARPPPRSGWVQRQEELGAVLALLEPYRARSGLQQGLAELMEHANLPASVRAWALHLRGTAGAEAVRELAVGLIDAEGAAATTAQRRLGVRLLDSLGAVGPERIRRSLGDLDPWIRAMGLRWAQREVVRGQFPRAEHAAALEAALADSDAGVFLLGAEVASGSLEVAACTRVLDLAVAGPRAWRARAWHVIESTLEGAGASGDEGFSAPGGNAALDARLRAAARVRRLWARRPR